VAGASRPEEDAVEVAPWKPAREVDLAIRAWMKAEGLPVDSTRYYADEEVYAWRHEFPGGSPTLWIARAVLEQHDAGAVVAGLNRLGVAARMRAAPKARFLIVDEDQQLYVTPWGHGPYRGQ
jgi:hypothetical protein